MDIDTKTINYNIQFFGKLVLLEAYHHVLIFNCLFFEEAENDIAEKEKIKLDVPTRID